MKSLWLEGSLINLRTHVRFEVFTAVPMENAVFWDTVCTDVSEGLIASVLRVENPESKEPA
jgi:hypothetical protein